jgi:hypothetical protein
VATERARVEDLVREWVAAEDNKLAAIGASGEDVDQRKRSITSFHPEMALFRNLGVNLQDRLCGVPTYASAQSLDFLDLANPAIAGLNWKLTLVPVI